MTAAIGFELAIVAIPEERVVVRIRFEINAPAVSAVAARWAATGNIFFTAKRDAAVAAVAGFYQDFSFVSEHVNHSPQKTAARRLPLKKIA